MRSMSLSGCRLHVSLLLGDLNRTTIINLVERVVHALFLLVCFLEALHQLGLFQFELLGNSFCIECLILFLGNSGVIAAF